MKHVIHLLFLLALAEFGQRQFDWIRSNHVKKTKNEKRKSKTKRKLKKKKKGNNSFPS